MSEITKLHKVFVCKKGECLFHQGEATRDLFIVKSGKARVYKMEGDIEIELDVIGPGGIIGEIAAIDGGCRSASVVAIEDTEAFIISPEEFKALTAKIPDWFQKIAMILAHRLRESDARIDRNLENDKTSHVAAAISLITYSDKCKACEGGFEVNSKVLENEIVDLLNIKFSEVASAVEKLEKQCLLVSDKGRTIIKNREKLDELSKTVFKTPAIVPET
jgi:CRP/FNR family cyclic AMP-dependent transcriptional regulator